MWQDYSELKSAELKWELYKEAQRQNEAQELENLRKSHEAFQAYRQEQLRERREEEGKLQGTQQYDWKQQTKDKG